MASKGTLSKWVERGLCSPLILFLPSCVNWVPVASVGDTPPKISINASIADGQTGYVEVPDFSFSGANPNPVVSNATAARDLVIVGSATNPGGVKSFSITITSQSRVQQKLDPIQKVEQTTAMNAQGLVPDLISVLADANSNLIKASTNDLAIVQLSATNFTGGSTTATVVYFPVDTAQSHSLQLADFVLSKVSGTSEFAGTFPSAYPGTTVRPNGHLVGLINGMSDTMHMLPPSGDCTVQDPSVLPFLGQGMLGDNAMFFQVTTMFPSSGAKLWYGSLKPLYGTDQPTVPITLMSCEKTVDFNNPNPLESKFSLPIKVVYIYN